MADDPISVNAKKVAEMHAVLLIATTKAEAAIEAREIEGLVTATQELLDATATLLVAYGGAMAGLAVDQVEHPALARPPSKL